MLDPLQVDLYHPAAPTCLDITRIRSQTSEFDS
jgi:hypothetical protein